MLKVFAAMGLSAALSVAAWAAPNAYRNEKWGFSNVYPDGWIVGEAPSGTPVVSAIAPPPERGVACNTTAEKFATTSNMSQSDINKANNVAFGLPWWLGNVYQRFSDIKFEKNEQRIHPSGISVQEAIATFNTVEGGKTFRTKAHTAIFFTPGKTYSTTCLTLEDKFAKYRNDFAKTIDSFETRGGLSADKATEGAAVPVSFDPAGQTLGVSAGVSLPIRP